MTSKKRTLFRVNTREDAAPNVVKAKIRDGEVVGIERLGKGEIETQRNKLFLDLYGRTKDGHNTKLTLVLTYQPDPQKILEAAGDKEAQAEKKQMELSYRLQATCKYLLENYTKEDLKHKQDEVTSLAYSKLEFAINNLEGFRVIDYFSNVKFLKKNKDVNKYSIEDFLESTDAFEELSDSTSGREQVIKKLSSEYASWYVANHPEYGKKINFWQPVYAKAFELYFNRIEESPVLKQKKFEEVVSKKEIEHIIEASYRGDKSV